MSGPAKVFGTATYFALRSPLEDLVTLTATGLLPCSNYSAELEKRPERISPPNWNLIFLIEPLCLRAFRPFEVSVQMSGVNARSLNVFDATGQVVVPITNPFVPTTLQDESIYRTDQFVVYARLPKSAIGRGARGCIVVPEGSLVPAIYYLAFGPSMKTNCDNWMSENCAERNGEPGGTDVPWPSAE